MTERLLQYIWQFRYLNLGSLHTTDGQLLEIIFAGNYNSNQGPDFLNAKVKIGNTVWAGNIELHVQSSEWNLHNHSNDKNYDNVILHVVWAEDVKLNLPFATLEIHQKVSKLLLKTYEELMQSRQFIPCEKHLAQVNELVLTKWKERLLVERLQQKTLQIETYLKKNNYHWEETFWLMLARSFGSKINSDAFERTAGSLPLLLLGKHRGQLIQLEALLMGQGGLLDKNFEESYPIMLQKEYRFLQKKYRLQTIQHPLYFLRMRPANFPTIRYAQLAVLLQQNDRLFDRLKEMDGCRDAEKVFDVTANDYWHYHYVFDDAGAFKEKKLGKDMITNILINTVAPMFYAYGYFNNKEQFKLKALAWLEQLSAEKNNICRGFEALGIENNTAFDSQALIQLKNEYCDHKHCLKCAVGNSILK